jgi:hypothetical protein
LLRALNVDLDRGVDDWFTACRLAGATMTSLGRTAGERGPKLLDDREIRQAIAARLGCQP